MALLLASVASPDEADLALAWGADILDLKDPALGALGAWSLEAVRVAVRRIDGRRPVSATVGDLPMQPALLAEAATRMAASGVDFVKIGFFAGGDHDACAAALGVVARSGARIVAVLMADQQPRFALLDRLAAAGLQGAMLDTADKSAGSLRHHLDDRTLTRFVAAARRRSLLTGLAGSLALDDIAPLAALGPDYLGFRGALCRGGRSASLDRPAFRSVRRALDAATAAAGLQETHREAGRPILPRTDGGPT